MVTRAEHESLEIYLRASLTEEQLERPLLISFTQWDFAVAALAETTMTLHHMGMNPFIGLWGSNTPLRDVGWQSHHLIARALGSPTIDDRARKAMISAGLPKQAFLPAPRWMNPAESLPEITHTYRSALRALTYRDAPLGRGILEVPPHADIPVTDEYSWPRAYVERAARSYAVVFDHTCEVIDKNNCTAVFTYNGRFLHDSAVAAAAQKYALPILAYDTGGLETDFDLTIDATHDWSALQDRMKVMYAGWPQPEGAEIGSAWFIDRRNHTESLNARFTGGQELGQGIEKRTGEVLVTYFSSSGDEIAELDLDWADYFGGQEGALLEVAQACRVLGYRLVVRTHPHKRHKPAQDVRDWHAAVERAQPDLHLDEHSPVDSYTLMEQSDIVVTYGSTTGVEAGFAERPVIVMGPSAYDELGCAVRVRNPEELHAALAHPQAGDRISAIPYGLMMKRRGFTYKYVTRGASGARLLGREPIIEPRPVVRHLSHALNRVTRRRLIA